MWCYQFTLFQRVMWPLKMCEIQSTTASRLDGIAKTYIRKWLGLPRCFSNSGLFGKKVLQLPLKSVGFGYKQEKARLVFEVMESRDHTIKGVAVVVWTRHKWRAKAEVDQAVSSCSIGWSWGESRKAGLESAGENLVKSSK